MTSRQSVSRTLYREQLIARTIAAVPEARPLSPLPGEIFAEQASLFPHPRLIESSQGRGPRTRGQKKGDEIVIDHSRLVRGEGIGKGTRFTVILSPSRLKYATADISRNICPLLFAPAASIISSVCHSSRAALGGKWCTRTPLMRIYLVVCK